MRNIESFDDFVGEGGKKPRVIAKTFKDQDKANEYYLKLCDKYDSVQLVRSPRFSEDGEYAWEVSESTVSEAATLDWHGEKVGDELEHHATGKNAAYRIYKDHRSTYFLQADGSVKCKGTLAVCKGRAEDLERAYVSKDEDGNTVFEGRLYPESYFTEKRLEAAGKRVPDGIVRESAVTEAAAPKYTYEPKNFYAAREWKVSMATAADKATYKRGYAKAKKLLDELISTLETLPRVDQFEDIPDAIKALREVRNYRLAPES